MLFSLKAPGSKERMWEGRMVYLNSRDRLETSREDKQITKEHSPINNTEQSGQQEQCGKYSQKP